MGTSVSAQEMNHERGVDIERYRTNWVSHLLGIAGDLHRRVVTRLAREGGYDQLRPSLGPFLSLVWREPRPVTELARQLSMSRQGCGKILRIAEEAGYAERIEGRAGERAQLVRLTGRGRRLVDDAVRMITENRVDLRGTHRRSSPESLSRSRRHPLLWTRPPREDGPITRRNGPPFDRGTGLSSRSASKSGCEQQPAPRDTTFSSSPTLASSRL